MLPCYGVYVMRKEKTTARTAGLRKLLEERRRELELDVRGRIRHGRSARLHEGRDDLEHSEADIQTDIGLALVQMRAETVLRIDEALGRLDAGQYGFCSECDSEISEPRLRALPFAVCCRTCEGSREDSEGCDQRRALRRDSPSFFPDPVRP
jgi:DnaK suppressor protein